MQFSLEKDKIRLTSDRSVTIIGERAVTTCIEGSLSMKKDTTLGKRTDLSGCSQFSNLIYF